MATDTFSTTQSALEATPAGTTAVPQVSIGMPVYNGEPFIREALDSLLAQTFTDFELIISDNASMDCTEAICREYAGKDKRIRYVRQEENRGAMTNFQFVLDEAVGEYFMWAAADDHRTADFLEINVFFLQSNPALSASASPNCYKGEESDTGRYVDFSLNGDYSKRLLAFLNNAWISHGIFYSLMKAEIIKSYQFPEFAYGALDWTINLYLLSHGEINRATSGLTILGKNGMSHQDNPWKTFRNNQIETVLPLYEFTRYALALSLSVPAEHSLKEMSLFLIALLKLNFKATKSNIVLTLINSTRHLND